MEKNEFKLEYERFIENFKDNQIELRYAIKVLDELYTEINSLGITSQAIRIANGCESAYSLDTRLSLLIENTVKGYGP